MTLPLGLGPADVALTSDDWYTPRWLFDAAGLVFDLDVCAPVDPSFRTCPARAYLTVFEDGLAQPWEGLVWMNPPFSNPAPWVARFADHPQGLALVPAANSHWRAGILKAADAIALISISTRMAGGGEFGFGRPDGSRVSYPVALILAARGSQAAEAVPRVSSADPHSQGAYHVRPAV